MLLFSFLGLLLDAKGEMNFQPQLLLSPLLVFFLTYRTHFLYPPSPPFLIFRIVTVLRARILESVSHCPCYDSDSAVFILLDSLAICGIAFLRAKALSCGHEWCWGAHRLGC